MLCNLAVSQVIRYAEYAKNIDAQLANLINISAVWQSEPKELLKIYNSDNSE